jgi:hypothetical protein
VNEAVGGVNGVESLGGAGLRERGSGAAASAVSVRIGSLVVDGLAGPPSRGALVGQALGPALERLFEQRGGPPGWRAGGALDSLAVTVDDLPPDAADWRVVEALSRALYRALDREW